MTIDPIAETSPDPFSTELLAQYRLPDAAPAESLRALTRIAAVLCGVEHAVVNLLDDAFQHQVGAIGFPGGTATVSESMCATAVRRPELHYVTDASREPAFADSPWVDGRYARVRFYASAPMVLGDGRVLGTLCVFDEQVRTLTDGQRRSLDELAAQAVALFERDRLARELAAARDEAQAATRAKSAFLAAVSHEVRTPLNGLLGMVELMLRDQLSEPQRERAEIVQRSGLTLLALLDDVLDLSKGEAQQVVLRPVPTDLHRLVQESVDGVRGTALLKGLRVDGAVQPGVPAVVLLDPDRLRQVLLNLLGNAVKFTSAGAVTLSARADGGRLRLTVADTGAGMTPEDIARLFTPFAQGSAGVKFGGTGLGLMLVDQLVTLMAGTIAVRSSPGQGTTFTLDLPLVPADGPVAPAPSRPSSALPYDSDVPRVLLVDDSEINLVVGSALLEAAGAEVTTAVDGVQALEQLRSSTFDLVLMDVQMPRLDGLSATRALRAEHGPGLPVVGLTGEHSPQEQQRCREAGMDEVLTKPVSGEALADLLSRLPALVGAADDGAGGG